jgi:radical SAM protein with 4Fe4S-binding SPASM domain
MQQMFTEREKKHDLKEKPLIYEKHHSFEGFYSSKDAGVVVNQRERAIRVLQDSLQKNNKGPYFKILSLALPELEKDKQKTESDFKVTPFVAEEMETLDDEQVPRYLFHRYRYDVFPKHRQLDDYPPYVQIEPSSICNYRCVFCYQQYFHKHSDMMGTMKLSTYKNIVDQLAGHVEFISLASRGEPLLCKDIEKMLEYSSGKFLGLKINTNASQLKEHHAHAILKGGVRTIVFSVDAVDEKTYAKLRINGNLKQVVRNIEMFQDIKAKHYPSSKIITRISGVKVNDSQNIEAMKSFWGRLADQVTFVKYMPWENVYESLPNDIQQPCSELWLRTFIWYDGQVNPCECDFLSRFSLGNVAEHELTEIWKSPKYQELRQKHLGHLRSDIEICKGCRFT